METNTNFVIEQGNSSNCEPVPNGEFETLESARQALTELETALGWRDLRITCETVESNVVTGREVVEYGCESDISEKD